MRSVVPSDGWGARGRPHRDGGHGDRRCCDGGDPPGGASHRQRIVAHVEGIAAPPQRRGERPGQQRLLDVQSLEEVQHAEGEREPERHLPGASATAREVHGEDEQGRAGGHGQGVEDRDVVERGGLQQQPLAPPHVGRQSRRQVRRADDRRGDRQPRRKLIRAAQTSQCVPAPMESQAPGRGVASGRDDVLPVLRHQPEPDRTGDPDLDRQVPEVENQSQHREGQHQPADMPLVDATATHVEARTVAMALQPGHDQIMRRSRCGRRPASPLDRLRSTTDLAGRNNGGPRRLDASAVPGNGGTSRSRQWAGRGAG